MLQITSSQAINEFDSLLRDVANGEEVIIIGPDGAAIKLIALSRLPKPMFGSAKGLVSIPPEFDDPIEGFEDYMS